jgi:hypothetical protein
MLRGPAAGSNARAGRFAAVCWRAVGPKPDALELPVLQSLWIGPRLTTLERMALRSWRAQGHAVHLYVYREPANLPAGVTLRDAAEVIPEREVFTQSRRAQRGAGGYSGFANWFRYELLHARGGWWVDTDVVCLRPLDFAGPCCAGWQDDAWINNAVIQAPAASALTGALVAIAREPHLGLPWDPGARRLRLRALQLLRRRARGDLAFGQTGPAALTAAVRHFGLERYVQPRACFFPIAWQEWSLPFEPGPTARERVRESHAVHLWNEMLRRKRVDKDAVFPPESLFEEWKARFL